MRDAATEPTTEAEPHAPEDGAAAAGAGSDERRLHPFSWLFVLITRLRPFVLPALVLLFVGRGSSWELWGALGAVLFAIYALIYAFGFRYRIAGEELIVREGVIFRTVRHVPFQRVQSVVQRRNALHRIFGVTELRLESAGGTRPEAVMNVITAAEADRLEHLLRSGERRASARSNLESDADAAAGDGESATADERAPEVLQRLTAGETLRLGLISNRGWIIVGMLVGLYWQFGPEDGEIFEFVKDTIGDLFSIWGNDQWSALAGLGLLVPAIIAFGLVLKPLSMVMTWLLFHDFTLTRDHGRLASVAGLLTRRSASARAERIQRLTVREPLSARLLRRRMLACDVAVQRSEGGDNDEMSRLHWLAPIATPAATGELIRELSPNLALTERDWRPLHPAAWRRVFKRFVLLALIVGVPLWLPLRELTVVPVIAILVYGWFHARGWARFAAWSFDGRTFAFRAGFLMRQWTIARLADGHAVVLGETPFDRRREMASVRLTTQGASRVGFGLRVPYLPVGDARTLAQELQARVADARGEP